MYLSDRDIAWALKSGRLIIKPPPTTIDPTSVDLHLDKISAARIWNIDAYLDDMKVNGVTRPELRVAGYNLAKFSAKYSVAPPEYDRDPTQLVGIRHKQVVVKPLGFVLWQTVEEVGTPETEADYICFVEGKSTRARAGIIVHLTAPTIHATWKGKITLEIFNAGPFDLVLEENDVIAQLIVSRITSTPEKGVSGTSVTFGQTSVDGTHPT